MTGIPEFDVAVVGAGPAGLAAANAAIGSDPRLLSVVVIDSADQPGGQFWRHRSERVMADNGRLHHGWTDYLSLREKFDQGIDSGVLTYRPSTSVWMVKPGKDSFTVYTAPSHGPGAGDKPIIRARRLILATGGYDRQIPIPGWDLPGVMAAGGVQAFAKQNGTLPGKRFVIGGTGPFLLPVAANVTDLGGDVLAVLESSHLSKWLPHAHRAVRVPEKAAEGAEYAWTFFKHRIPYRTRTVITEILGDDRVEAVKTARVDRQGATVAGTEALIDNVDTVGLGWGFTPQLELPLSLNARTRVDTDGSLVGVVDEMMRSTVPGLYLAGEVTGVGGAALAAAEGQIAGAAARMDSTEETVEVSRTVRRVISRHRSFADAMHSAHPIPQGWSHRLHEDTIVCRCEEVSAGEVERARNDTSAVDPRSQKNMTRAGMGWCQGRVCGFSVACLSGGPEAASLAQTMKRPVAQPIALAAFFEL